MDADDTREDDMTLLRDAHSGRFVRTGVWHAAGGMQWRILKVDGRSRTVPGPDGRPAEVGIATTGIAGPDSPDGQPVGTVHIGVRTPDDSRVLTLRLDGDRESIRTESVGYALAALSSMV